MGLALSGVGFCSSCLQRLAVDPTRTATRWHCLPFSLLTPDQVVPSRLCPILALDDLPISVVCSEVGPNLFPILAFSRSPSLMERTTSAKGRGRRVPGWRYDAAQAAVLHRVARHQPSPPPERRRYRGCRLPWCRPAWLACCRGWHRRPPCAVWRRCCPAPRRFSRSRPSR